MDKKILTKKATDDLTSRMYAVILLLLMTPFTAFFWFEVYYFGGFDYLDLGYLNYFQIWAIVFIVGYLKL